MPEESGVEKVADTRGIKISETEALIKALKEKRLRDSESVNRDTLPNLYTASLHLFLIEGETEKNLQYIYDNRDTLQKATESRTILRTIRTVNNVLRFVDVVQDKQKSESSESDAKSTHSQENVLREKLRDFGASFIENNKSKIEGVIKDNTLLEDKIDTLEALSHLAYFTRDSSNGRRNFEALMRHVNQVLKLLGANISGNKLDLSASREQLQTLLGNMLSSPVAKNDYDLVLENLTRFLEEGGSIEEEIMYSVVDRLITTKGEKGMSDAFGLVNRMLLRHDLDLFNKLDMLWMLSGSRDRFPIIVMANLRKILDLEQERRGIASTLYSEFGIADFARYPSDFLVKQYDEKENKATLPVGIIVFPRTDHSGVFYSQRKVLQTLFNDLKDKAKIVVWEVGSSLELVHSVNATRHKYGKIEFAILGGHGGKDTLRLSTEGFKHKPILDTEDFQKKGSGALRHAFVENPTIILDACSTGELGGIGQEISKLGATVIAPPKPVGLASIVPKISQEGKIIEWHVTYFAEHFDVSPNVYKKGIQT